MLFRTRVYFLNHHFIKNIEYINNIIAKGTLKKKNIEKKESIAKLHIQQSQTIQDFLWEINKNIIIIKKDRNKIHQISSI